MTWLEVFEQVSIGPDDDERDEDEKMLEALFDRYRAEGYPGLASELPADLLLQ